ncbi:MAG: glycosyltransferase [Hyphomicrobiales bacterium]|nr:glycosyltransferase [Hyphomicrobiales bacterium]
MDKTALIVSPFFPPSALAGVHRARHLAKHLPAAGWRPIVVCVDERFHEQRLDLSLAMLVPASVKIEKTPAAAIGLTRPFGLGDISLRAWFPLKKAIAAQLKAHPGATTLITGSPFYPMALAGWIKRRFGGPVVLDFQDPWLSAWGARFPAASKGGAVHRISALLEPRALRNADYVTSVSPVHNAEMAQRYPWFDARRMAAIPIGCDRDDFSVAPGGHGPTFHEDGRFELSYVGAYWPAAEKPVRAFLRALRSLKERRAELPQRLRVNFIGTDPTLNAAQSHVAAFAAQYGVSDCIREMPARLPYLQALAAMKASDALLMIGSDEAHYTASKIYPALMSGRPYLAIFHAESSATAILRRAGGGLVVSFSDADDIDLRVDEMAQALERVVDEAASFGPAEPAVFREFEADAIARRFAAVFDAAAIRR